MEWSAGALSALLAVRWPAPRRLPRNTAGIGRGTLQGGGGGECSPERASELLFRQPVALSFLSP